jgi:hypothetical protein
MRPWRHHGGYRDQAKEVRNYASHIRGEGDTLLPAIAEAIEVGRRASVPVEVSHLKAAGRSNWPRMAQAIELIHAARAEGLDVTADMSRTQRAARASAPSCPPGLTRAAASRSSRGWLFHPLSALRGRARLGAPTGIRWPTASPEGRELWEVPAKRTLCEA